jgi:hypothetical protein
MPTLKQIVEESDNRAAQGVRHCLQSLVVAFRAAQAQAEWRCAAGVRLSA